MRRNLLPGSRRPAHMAVAMLVLVLVLSACGGASEADVSDAGANTGVGSDIVAAARVGGASEEQLAILAKGAVPSFEDYEAAVNRTLACIEDAGIGTTPVGRYEQGVVILGYGYEASSPGRTDAQTDEITQECIREHSQWVELAWSSQPAALEWKEQQRESERPDLISCLEAYGIDVDESWTTDEVRARVGELAREKGAVDVATQLRCNDHFGFFNG